MDRCVEWLTDFLGGQIFKHYEVVKAEAEKQGFSKGQLSKARKVLGVTAVSDSSIHGEAQTWFWLIPREDSGDA